VFRRSGVRGWAGNSGRPRVLDAGNAIELATTAGLTPFFRLNAPQAGCDGGDAGQRRRLLRAYAFAIGAPFGCASFWRS
jgi:hypothetical protein